jgi:hypothetical protein
MTCFCGAIALRHVNEEGFCKLHEREAFEAAARDKRMQQSIAGLLMRDHHLRGNDDESLGASRHRF